LDDEGSVLRNAFLFVYLLSLPVIAAAQTNQSGNWSATSTSGAAFRGSWTAVPDSNGSTVRGTWTLIDGNGAKIAEGGWTAAKAATEWSGAWRAKAAGHAEEYTGTWTSTVDVKSGRFNDLFEKAIEAAVSGAWGLGGKSGAWSIRAAPHLRPFSD
jgi:hypothetical protein